MTNPTRRVRFSNSVEEFSFDKDDSSISSSAMETDNHEDNIPRESITNVTTSRRNWNPSEVSFFSDHQPILEKLDLSPRQPQRSLDSILDEALKTCDMQDESMYDLQPNPMLKLDASLFSISSSSCEDNAQHNPSMRSSPHRISFDTADLISEAVKILEWGNTNGGIVRK